MFVSRLSRERMNSSNDLTRMNINEDRLSSLPDELIYRILSFIGFKQVVQTSVLSSRWRFIWTSTPYLNISGEDFSKSSKVSRFINHVLSGRNNQTEVSCVNLWFGGKDSDMFVEQITKYAFSHNIQQLNVACLLENYNVEFPSSLLSCRSLKYLSFTNETFSTVSRRSFFDSYVLKATSTWDLPSLTTLYLHEFSLCCDENTESVNFFSKCSNLRNLTLKGFYTKGFTGLSICLPFLCSLTLNNVSGSVEVLNIVAPQLKNLTVWNSVGLQLSAYDFPSLKKADICISFPRNAHQIVCLLQRLHNVKFLTLNLEIVELLSSAEELMSQQPSPFANLNILKIHPEKEYSYARVGVRETMSAEVKSYLLDSSPGVSFTMVTREDVRTMKNTNMAESLITELRELLEKTKASTKTKMTKMHEIWKPKVVKNINSYVDKCWKCMSFQIEKEKENIYEIISMLKEIKNLLRQLPPSNMAIIQPTFSNLCVEADVVMNIVTDFMKMNCDENQRRLSACFHELATKWQPSS